MGKHNLAHGPHPLGSSAPGQKLGNQTRHVQKLHQSMPGPDPLTLTLEGSSVLVNLIPFSPFFAKAILPMPRPPQDTRTREASIVILASSITSYPPNRLQPCLTL